MKKINATGFSAVEVLLVLILLAILGFTGFYVYNAQNKTNKTLSDTSKDSTAVVPKKTVKTATSGNNATQKYLVIKEWGIELPLDSTFQDATYACLGEDCSVPNEMGISTASLAALDSQCSANSSGVGFITRQTKAEEAASSDTGDFITVGDYTYRAMPTTAHCSNANSAANLKQASYMQAFKDAVKGIKAVQ